MTSKAKRRRFTAEYKQKILKEAAACDRGERGALLRREGERPSEGYILAVLKACGLPKGWRPRPMTSDVDR